MKASPHGLGFSVTIPVPRTTAVRGSGATYTGTPSICERSSGRPRSIAPPPKTVTPRSRTSERSSGGVRSITSFIASIRLSSDGASASRTWLSVRRTSRGRPVARSRPRIGRTSSSSSGSTAPMAIFVSSAVFSPMASWNSLRTKSMMFSLKRSPATCELLLATVPPRAIMAMSVVPAPMSSTMVPIASVPGSFAHCTTLNVRNTSGHTNNNSRSEKLGTAGLRFLNEVGKEFLCHLKVRNDTVGKRAHHTHVWWSLAEHALGIYSDGHYLSGLFVHSHDRWLVEDDATATYIYERIARSEIHSNVA